MTRTNQSACRVCGATAAKSAKSRNSHFMLSGALWLQNLSAARGLDVARDTALIFLSSISAQELHSIAANARTMCDVMALGLLSELGYIASSIEQQHRAIHGRGPSEFVFDVVPGLEPALVALGDRLGRAPRDDADTAWANGPAYSWTGTEGERRFGDAVREINDRMNCVAEEMLELRRGRIGLLGSVAMLERAVGHIRVCRDKMADLAKKPFPNEFQMMRNHLIEMMIGGKTYEGPNATYLPGWNRADLAIGIYDERFDDAISERIQHMPSADAAMITAERDLPSLAQIVVSTLGVDLLQQEIDTTLEKRPDYVAALRAAACLAKEMAIFVGVHMGAIKANLVADPDSPDDPGITHGAGRGVSGRPIDITEQLMQMRLRHPMSRMRIS